MVLYSQALQELNIAMSIMREVLSYLHGKCEEKRLGETPLLQPTPHGVREKFVQVVSVPALYCNLPQIISPFITDSLKRFSEISFFSHVYLTLCKVFSREQLFSPATN
jgi:hypothetical protein